MISEYYRDQLWRYFPIYPVIFSSLSYASVRLLDRKGNKKKNWNDLYQSSFNLLFPISYFASDLHFPYFAHRGHFHLLNLTELYPLSVSFSSTVVISSLTSSSRDFHRACSSPPPPPSPPSPPASISGSIKDGRSSKREIKRERSVLPVTFHAWETYHGKQETVDRKWERDQSQGEDKSVVAYNLIPRECDGAVRQRTLFLPFHLFPD